MSAIPEINPENGLPVGVGKRVADMSDDELVRIIGAVFETKTKELTGRSFGGLLTGHVADAPSEKARTRKLLNDGLRATLLGPAWAAANKIDLAENQRSLTEGTAGDGGYLVPVEHLQEVLQARPNISPFRSVCRVVPMSSKTSDTATVATKPTADWIDEAAEITESNPTTGQVILTARKLAVLSKTSIELVQDSRVDLFALLAQLHGEAHELKAQNAFAVGNGTLKPKGIHSASYTTVTAAGSSTAVTYGDVNRLYMGLPQQYRASAVFVGNAACIAAISGIISTTGQPIFRMPMSGELYPTVFGRPVIELPDLPGAATSGDKAHLYFGDFTGGYLIGDRMGTEFATSDKGVGFKYAQIEVRSIQRLDGKPTIVDYVRDMDGVYAS